MNDESSLSGAKPSLSFKAMLRKFLKYKINTREELLAFLSSAKTDGLIDNEALQMIDGVLDVNDMQARDLMIPRAQMVVVEQESDPKEFIPMIIESGHSRFPVIGGDKDGSPGFIISQRFT